MATMQKQESTLVFIPLPVISHLLSTIRLAKLLTDTDHRLSITIILVKLQSQSNIAAYTQNSPNSRINFVQLQRDESNSAELNKSNQFSTVQLVESQKGAVRAAITGGPAASNLAGIFVDILCSSMIDVAAELGVPSYVFFTCGAAVLGLMFHLQSLSDGRDGSLAAYEGSDAEISISTYANPVPAKVWPSAAFNGSTGFLDLTRKLREADGIVINTFLELETHAVTALAADSEIPTIYPVGPLLQDEEATSDRAEILGWLDKQPDSSVVFLCFGSNGQFNNEDQLREIAAALEKSGRRFLWSLKENPAEALPEGFLERTEGVGKVIGWAPQMAVLSHAAVGGFVTHCGWNSILESVWCGVPMAAWPMFAEQQANAFMVVKELEIAVEIMMDYRRNTQMFVGADKIEKGIRELMDPQNKIRANVKRLMEKSRASLKEGGSSHHVVHRFLQIVTPN